ncbi:hypothetical protein ATY76_19905 [Rhizobium sp. R339]|nr:hypothetical protein ATY76_19905 [Rhizobium sp. R339]
MILFTCDVTEYPLAEGYLGIIQHRLGLRPFQLALQSMVRLPQSVGQIAPIPGFVDQFFDDSIGEGDLRAVDVRCLSNEEEPWNIVEADIVARRGTKREPSVGSAAQPLASAARMPAGVR